MTWQKAMAIDRAYSAERCIQWAAEDYQTLIFNLNSGFIETASVVLSSLLSNLQHASVWWKLAKELDD